MTINSSILTPFGVFMFISSYRVFPRVILRVRAILDSIVSAFAVHPRRRLGGAGGPAAPFGGVRGAMLPDSCCIYSIFNGYSSPLERGDLGGSHRSLLDLPVRTDTKGVGRGLKGDLTVPIRCESCGLPIAKCSCIAGIDY